MYRQFLIRDNVEFNINRLCEKYNLELVCADGDFFYFKSLPNNDDKEG
tara:strand:+ start:840 stop:983 length:144 start_codon:yes stop_codon:yes gene_type:complete